MSEGHPLVVVKVPDCEAARFSAIADGLVMRSDERLILVVAELRGRAIVLGRHQRARSALSEAARASGVEIVRRTGGGRALHTSDGDIGVVLWVPPGISLFAHPFGPDKALNRYVRGLLAGLSTLGANAHYFGRDFVSADKRRLAALSQDGSPSGGVLLEAIVAMQHGLAMPEGWSGYPAHSDPRAGGPEDVALVEIAGKRPALGEVAEALAHGYARMHGVAPQHVDKVALDGAIPEPAIDEDEHGFARSGVAEVPIGFIEALARRDGDHIAEARLRGDFIMPAFTARAIEASLASAPIDVHTIGGHVHAALQHPQAALAGILDPRIITEAILVAAKEPPDA